MLIISWPYFWTPRWLEEGRDRGFGRTARKLASPARPCSPTPAYERRERPLPARITTGDGRKCEATVANVRKVGNSMGVILTKDVVESLGVTEGTSCSPSRPPMAFAHALCPRFRHGYRVDA